LVVSDAEFDDFETQKSEAAAFLSAHNAALTKIRQLPGLQQASIDFGIEMRNVVVQSDCFEHELIDCIAPLRLQIVLSQYPVAKKMKRIKQYRRALRKGA